MRYDESLTMLEHPLPHSAQPVETDERWLHWCELAQTHAEDVEVAVKIGREAGPELPLPGHGATAARWDWLARLAAADLTTARVVEAHTDALAILAEAGLFSSHFSANQTWAWGVFAAEAPGTRLEAVPTRDGWQVTGTKPWCSLAAHLDAALITARVGDQRQLFAVALQDPSVQVRDSSAWVARGLRRLPSGPVDFHHTTAYPVGPPGWYLTRPGFAWGGIGVAACWYGGAQALYERLRSHANAQAATAAAAMAEPPAILTWQLGQSDLALAAASAVLQHAAAQVDAGVNDGSSAELLALRARSAVAVAAEAVLTHTAHALGPGPLAFDGAYARRHADLQLYLGQHHADRDLARLGCLVISDYPADAAP